MSGKNANLQPYVGEISEGFTGSCTVADFELLLQMIHVSFTKPRVSESAFNSYMNKEKGMLENSMLDPQSAWSDTMRWSMSGNHPRKRPITPEILNEANYKRVKYIYNQRFSDPGNFTFYFVGNVDPKVAKPLIEKYLGSLPVVEKNETFVDLGIRTPMIISTE
jgi:zinc protease